MSADLIGRERSRERLLTAVRDGKSLLILGERGIGKTALLDASLASLEPSRIAARLPFSRSFHELLMGIAKQLLRKKHPYFHKFDRRSLSAYTSVRLRGVVLSGLSAHPCCVAIEDIDNAGPGLYRFAQKLFYMKGVSLLLTTRSTASLGYLARLFWNPADILQLESLSHSDSTRLLERLANEFRVELAHLESLKQHLFHECHGNPGWLTEMCRLAVDDRYRRGANLWSATIRMELTTRFLDSGRARGLEIGAKETAS